MLAGGGLGQERLVRHVRLRVDDGDLGLAAAQLPLQAQGGVEPDVAATDDQDAAVALHATEAQARTLRLRVTMRQRDGRRPRAARRRTSSSIGSVSRPVKVFCWLGW